MSAPVSLCDELSVQTREPLPFSVQVGSVSVPHSPHMCAVGSMAISFVSLCVASRVQTLVSSPFAVQVAAFITVHSPHWWVWAGGGVVPLSPLSHPVKDRAVNASAVSIAAIAANPNVLIAFFILKTPFLVLIIKGLRPFGSSLARSCPCKHGHDTRSVRLYKKALLKGVFSK
jgi:hypothetical protein